MGSQLTCDLCQNEPAILMQSNILNGESVTVGESCILIFLLTTAGTILEDLPSDVAAQYGDMLAPLIAKLAVTVPTSVRREDATDEAGPLHIEAEGVPYLPELVARLDAEGYEHAPRKRASKSD